MSKKVDLAWMIRTGKATPGQWISGSLSWSFGGEHAGSVSYVANERVDQQVRLVFTEPNYGGRRWWMVCPYKGVRAGKLYLPNGGDRFASRRAWRLNYQSQRVGRRDRVFEKLFRLQRKLGCEQGCDSWIRRPKGMWRRTFDRHLDQFEELDAQCGAEMAMLVLRLGGRL